MRSAIGILVALTISFASHSQRTYVGFFPEAAVSKKVGESWKLTGKIESQHILFSNDAISNNEWGYEHDRTDLQFFVARNLTLRTKGALGYQFRIEGKGKNSHRTIQQIGWLSNFRNYRLGHRVRADQTFFEEGVSWRMRYRISSDIPINGQVLDPGENYLIASNELIAEYFESEINLENRLVAGIGWYFKNKQKLELSIDYRLDPIVSSPQRNRIWTKVSFYLNL